VISLVFSGPADLLAVRFARSPVWETLSAVRTLAHDRSHEFHGPWRDAVAGEAARLELEPLLAVNPARGTVPDFLTPPPQTPSPRLRDQLAEIRATPADQVERELAMCRATVADATARRAIDALSADPAAARELLAGQIHEAWRRLVAPFWPRIAALVDADVAYRSHLLAGRGLGAVLGDLDTRIRWRDGTVTVDDPHRRTVNLDGRGLVLMPSAYVWPAVVVVVDEPWQPTIIYPARGIAELWRSPSAPPAALGRLLGRTRALLLDALDPPASTTTLAGRLGLSPSGVSRHLIALRDAGLVRTARHGHEVRYARTRLGSAVLRGAGTGPAGRGSGPGRRL
jgi:DNA-binding transcriptional ArsR family regulator